jgi:hypothetical protein
VFVSVEECSENDLTDISGTDYDRVLGTSANVAMLFGMTLTLAGGYMVFQRDEADYHDPREKKRVHND